MADEYDKVHERINKLAEAVVRTDERVGRHREELNTLNLDLKALARSVSVTNQSIARIGWMVAGMTMLFGFWKAGGFDAVVSFLSGGSVAIR